MTAHRFALEGARELVVAQQHGLVVVSVHAAGECVSGPLALRAGDVARLRSALGGLADVELAADMERVREVLRASPGIAGYDRLRGALSSMAMRRRRAAVAALRAAGEVENHGTNRRPLLHIAPKADYFASRAPSTTGVDLDPSPDSNARDSGATLRVEGQPPEGAAGPQAEGSP